MLKQLRTARASQSTERAFATVPTKTHKVRKSPARQHPLQSSSGKKFIRTTAARCACPGAVGLVRLPARAWRLPFEVHESLDNALLHPCYRHDAKIFCLLALLCRPRARVPGFVLSKQEQIRLQCARNLEQLFKQDCQAILQSCPIWEGARLPAILESWSKW